MKASTPAFNISKKVPLPENAVSLDVAVFGVRIPNAIMQIFGSYEMRRLSRTLKIPIPNYDFDSFVQKKMVKVLDLVKEAKSMKLDTEDLKAVDRLDCFCKWFQELNGATIRGVDQFNQMVDKHVLAGWQDNLSFDTLLVKTFGFSKAVSDKLRLMSITIKEDDKEKQVTLEQHSLRWLSKAFQAYGPVGCLADLVNMIYAMMNMTQPSTASENATVKVLKDFQRLIQLKDFSSLWIPTHLFMDGESDDALSWLLLEYIHQCKGTQLQVLVQLPDDKKFDEIANFFSGSKRSRYTQIKVFRDKDSANGKAVYKVWLPYVSAWWSCASDTCFAPLLAKLC